MATQRRALQSWVSMDDKLPPHAPPGNHTSQPHVEGTPDTYTLLSVMDMESSVSASLDNSLSLALVAGAKT